MSKLYDCYLFHRQRYHRTPKRALESARMDVAADITRYPSRGGGNVGGVPSDSIRWVENPSAAGLRYVGFADEVNHWIRHKGWYTSPDGDDGEVYRGVVYLLPGRNRAPRFVGGYSNPWNDGVRIDFGSICEDSDTAANIGDRLAEIDAEKERDYQEAWQAGRQCEDLLDEAKAELSRAIALVREMRAARKQGAMAGDTICATLRNSIAKARETAHSLFAKRVELIDNYGRHPGFVE